MKLIIDIPEEVKHNVYAYGLSLCPSDKEQLINAIMNGIPLDEDIERYEQAISDIRTRLLIIREEDYECDGCSDMDMVLDIIDECLGEKE